MPDASTIKTLNRLIEVSRDGELGFVASAKDVSDPELAAVLRARAQECREALRDLQELVRMLGSEPRAEGSLTGALHRGWGSWDSAKAAAVQHRNHAILVECEKGEDHARKVYGAALKEKLSPQVYALVAAQYQGVVKNHDRIKALRDRFVR
ncbi:PA2169 family four-helix-bundle protein [Burkholderia sp. L27(2015)]|uniref:PA2169 family four-helix-bundle protein n=1 Tax=Burkholderia sp. L27(2015) TaxID=1641858 RepID=UPI00131A93EC|nr:PA2169 family four-helix-bundle protein [Burkholderia sp. L27(2015)]